MISPLDFVILSILLILTILSSILMIISIIFLRQK